MDHDTVLTTLLGLANKRRVHLVSRCVFGDSHVTPGKVWFFIPDLHLLRRSTATQYDYSFGASGANGGVPTHREPLLFELCEKLEPLVQTGDLFVFQLGDFADLFREERISPNQDLASMLRGILDDNPAASTFLAPEARLNTSLVLGNHDHVKQLSWQRVPVTQRMRVSFALPPNGSVIVTHGDLFDPIEDLPDPWARWAVQFLPGKDASTKPLGHAIEIQSPASVPARHGVSNNHPLVDRATRFRSGVNDGDANKLKRLGLTSKLPVRLFVIGHTHHPRIVQHAMFFVGHMPVAGVNIMDCGGWIEKSQLSDGVVPSCHVGVIAETAAGADARIYQLTPN
jgi:hypothetical protein